MWEDKRSKLYIARFSNLLAKGPLSWLLECSAEPAQGSPTIDYVYICCAEKSWSLQKKAMDSGPKLSSKIL